MDQALLKERMQIFTDAIELKKPSRVPTYGSVYTWKFFDTDCMADKTLPEILCDWNLIEQVVREHLAWYRFDINHDYGERNTSNYSKVVGMDKMYYIVTDTGINVPDITTMREDEYPAYTADPDMFSWTQTMPARFGDLTYGQIRTIVEMTLENLGYFETMDKIRADFSLPRLHGSDFLLYPELIIGGYRGIRGFGIDMRRHFDEIKALCEKMAPAVYQQADDAIANQPDDCVCAGEIGMLIHTVMNRRQFEQLYWPTVKTIVDKIIAAGKKVTFMFEGEALRLADFFRDFAPGHINFLIEMDDLREMRRALPNVCLAGGMTPELLGSGTAQECVDTAHGLIDDLADTGFILSQNKMLSFKGDAARENMLAVQEFALQYEL